MLFSIYSETENVEEPHAPDVEAEASDSEPEAHVMEPLAGIKRKSREIEMKRGENFEKCLRTLKTAR